MSTDGIRYDQTAVETWRRIWGPDFLPPFPRIAETTEAMAPLSAAQGAVMSNETLPIETRTILIFATLVSLGFQPEAKLYMQGLRNLGFTVREIAEMIAQVALYAGVPRGVDANMLLTELVAEDGERADAEGFFYKFPRE
jgi:alkylhydroperoxidase/carboxymuconolactone decarboxylase family protein YurZ